MKYLKIGRCNKQKPIKGKELNNTGIRWKNVPRLKQKIAAAKTLFTKTRHTFLEKKKDLKIQRYKDTKKRYKEVKNIKGDWNITIWRTKFAEGTVKYIYKSWLH